MPAHTTSRVIATQNTETYHPPRRDSLAHILLLIRTNRMTQGARHLPGKAPNHCLKTVALSAGTSFSNAERDAIMQLLT